MEAPSARPCFYVFVLRAQHLIYFSLCEDTFGGTIFWIGVCWWYNYAQAIHIISILCVHRLWQKLTIELWAFLRFKTDMVLLFSRMVLRFWLLSPLESYKYVITTLILVCFFLFWLVVTTLILVCFFLFWLVWSIISWNNFKSPRHKCFMGFKLQKKIMHLKLYRILLEVYIKVSKEKNCVFDAIETIPCIAKKTYWAFRCIETI